MIPAVHNRQIVSSPVTDSGEFGISYENSAHIMTILRDTLYSDKVLAVLREYSANAWDAHRDAGIGDRPIEVTLPTNVNPTLSIRDFGRGLSKEDVFKIYTQYGASTKRNSDIAVGMLGIGSKSGFAYADTFTVTSFHGGIKSIYSAVLDASDKGVVNLIHEEPTEETGLLIEIAVDPYDIHEFQSKAKNLYKYFNPLPKCNIEIPTLEVEGRYASGIIHSERSYGDNWIAVMGCIPYRINMDSLIEHGKTSNIPPFVQYISGALFFNIGEVHINASREELKYTEQTKKAIIEKINLLVEEHVKTVIADLESNTKTLWEKRLRAQELRNFKEVFPGEYKALMTDFISLYTNGDPNYSPLWFSQTNGKDQKGLRARPTARIIFRDDQRSLKGFSFGSEDVLLRRRSLTTEADFKVALEKFIKDKQIDGVPVVNTSTLEWTAPPKSARGGSNPKHRQRVFKWVGTGKKISRKASWHSDCWEALDHTPSDKDVYVEIESFKPYNYSNFFNHYEEDAKLAEITGISIPQIVAYKVTEKSPSKTRDGTTYLAWREKFLVEVLKHPKFLEYWENWHWATFGEDIKRSYYYNSTRFTKASAEKVYKMLGTKHDICELIRNTPIEEDRDYNRADLFRSLESRKAFAKLKGTSKAEQLAEKIKKKYPLFALESVKLSSIMGSDYEEWIKYVQLVDKGSK